MADPLTIVYMSMAYHLVSEKDRMVVNNTIGGEMETLDNLVSYADTVDKAFDDMADGNDWDGVFCYDIAAPVGTYIMQRFIAGETPTPEEVEGYTKNLFRERMAA